MNPAANMTALVRLGNPFRPNAREHQVSAAAMQQFLQQQAGQAGNGSNGGITTLGPQGNDVFVSGVVYQGATIAPFWQQMMRLPAMSYGAMRVGAQAPQQELCLTFPKGCPGKLTLSQVMLAGQGQALPDPHMRAGQMRKYDVVAPLDLRGSPGAQHAMSCGVFKVRYIKDKSFMVEKRIALGCPSRQKRCRAEIRTLYQIMLHGRPSNINAIKEHFWNEGLGYASIYLEYCERGSCDDYITKASQKRETDPQFIIGEEFMWHILEGVSGALAFLHDGLLDVATAPYAAPHMQPWDTIYHLDVKPGNIFLSNTRQKGPMLRVVLGDFGCSVRKSDLLQGKENPEKQTYGTVGWYAPEHDTGYRFPDPIYFGTFSDVWQMAGSVQAMCHLTTCPDQKLARDKVSCGQRYSIKLNDIINRCMSYAPKDRPRAAEVAIDARVELEKRGLYRL